MGLTLLRHAPPLVPSREHAISTDPRALSKPLVSTGAGAHHEVMTLVDQPAPNAPSGYVLPDLADLVLEVGASYPMLAYAVQADEEFEEDTALDPVIFAGLLHP
jgi:hypothetical protein